MRVYKKRKAFQENALHRTVLTAAHLQIYLHFPPFTSEMSWHLREQ